MGWQIKRQGGSSHRILARPGWPDILFAYHDKVTLGPTAVKVLAKKTGLNPEDLWFKGPHRAGLGRIQALQVLHGM